MGTGESGYRRFIAGEREAFEEVIDEYRESLIFFIYRYIGDIETAEDIAEDVFVELIIHPYRYDFKASLKTYIFSIGRNKAVDYIRKRSRLSFMDESTFEFADFADTADVKSLEQQVIDDERLRRVCEVMGQIKKEYRVALHLVYFEELSYEEVGRIMKKSRKQVENLIYRGKNAIRRILEEEWFD